MDGIIRRVKIRYFNSGESTARFIDRSIRKVVRLFNVDETSWHDDIEKVQAKLKENNVHVDLWNVLVPASDEPVTSAKDKRETSHSSILNVCDCCCEAHCNFVIHCSRPVTLTPSVDPATEYVDTITTSYDDADDDEDTHLDCGVGSGDAFVARMTALNSDFSTSGHNM